MSDSIAEVRSLKPTRVCLIKPSSLGDVVHAFPTLTALRELWPAAKFSWVINQGLRGLVEGHPAIDDVILFDRSRVSIGPRGILAFSSFLRDLRRRRFDLTVDLQGLLRSGLMTWATGAPIRLGLSEAREGATRFYTHCVPASTADTHAVDRMLRLAERCGASVATPQSIVAMTEQDRRWAREILSPLPRPRMVLNLGARWLTKRWPPEHFATVAQRAIEERGAAIIAVGAPEDRPLVAELKGMLGSTAILDLCGQTTLPQLAALATESDLFLSNDTGPLHLAAAAGARVVGIYTCTSPRRTGPYGPEAIAVQSCVWCAPSYIKSCDRLECMSELTPDRVWPAVARQLTRSSRSLPDAA